MSDHIILSHCLSFISCCYDKHPNKISLKEIRFILVYISREMQSIIPGKAQQKAGSKYMEAIEGGWLIPLHPHPESRRRRENGVML